MSRRPKDIWFYFNPRLSKPGGGRKYSTGIVIFWGDTDSDWFQQLCALLAVSNKILNGWECNALNYRQLILVQLCVLCSSVYNSSDLPSTAVYCWLHHSSADCSTAVYSWALLCSSVHHSRAHHSATVHGWAHQSWAEETAAGREGQRVLLVVKDFPLLSKWWRCWWWWLKCPLILVATFIILHKKSFLVLLTVVLLLRRLIRAPALYSYFAPTFSPLCCFQWLRNAIAFSRLLSVNSPQIH